MDKGYKSSDALTGWVLNFFPYSKNGERDNYAHYEELERIFKLRAKGEKYMYYREMKGKKLPSSLSKIPV